MSPLGWKSPHERLTIEPINHLRNLSRRYSAHMYTRLSLLCRINQYLGIVKALGLLLVLIFFCHHLVMKCVVFGKIVLSPRG